MKQNALLPFVVLSTVALMVFFVYPELVRSGTSKKKCDTHQSPNCVNSGSLNVVDNQVDETENRILPKQQTDLIGNVSEHSSDTARRRNVLFFIADDLRPQIGAYHNPEHPDYFSRIKIQTPNIDHLAASSILFKHAYVQFSLCGPSRTSILTSRRPEVTRVFSNWRYWRDSGGNFTTLPQYFKNNGYLSLGFGKVFHPHESSNDNDAPSWSRDYYSPPFSDRHYLPKGSAADWGIASGTERERIPLTDDYTTKMAKETLQGLAEKAKSGEQPFFVAVGYRKPHLSIVCPEEYFHLYPLESKNNFMAIKSWENPIVRKAASLEEAKQSGEEKILSSESLRNIRRAYFACISYVDAQIGEVLRELERLGLADNTIITFTSDHGYNLGENRRWGKRTTSEISNRVPLMIRIPGATDNGIVSDAIVESVDLYPTIVEAAGLDNIPQCPAQCSDIEVCTQGESLMPLLADPDGDREDAAFSQVPDGKYMRHTIRTRRFRLVDVAEVIKTDLPDRRFGVSARWKGDTEYVELYDHTSDILEQVNLVDAPQYADVIAQLRERLHQFVKKQHFEPKRIV